MSASDQEAAKAAGAGRRAAARAHQGLRGGGGRHHRCASLGVQKARARVKAAEDGAGHGAVRPSPEVRGPLRPSRGGGRNAARLTGLCAGKHGC